jgi:hypothetical protein
MSEGAITLIEQRTYQLGVGQVSAYLKLYEAEGLPVQWPVLGCLLGYYSVESGGLNTVVHQWGFTGHADRDARRALLQANPAWQAYWAQARALVIAQQSMFLKPAPFFATPLARIRDAAAPTL